MTDTSSPGGLYRKKVSRHKTKQADGIVTRCTSRVAKSGSFAHAFQVGSTEYSLFTEDELSPAVTGDHIRFEYEIRRYRTGSRREYLAIIPQSLEIIAPAGLADDIAGNVYVLSNPSMPGLLKVGFTTGVVSKRISELSSVTSIPTGFRLEWSQPVVGSPRAVEQRAHALLASSKSGKEFFRVPLQRAKDAVIQSLAELYPEQALAMGAAFAERAQAEIVRRQQLAENLARRAEEQRNAEIQRAFEMSREGQWRRHGAIEVVLWEFDLEPNRNSPSLIAKMFGSKFIDYADFRIHPYQYGETIEWSIAVTCRSSEKMTHETRRASSQQDAMKCLIEMKNSIPVSNSMAVVAVQNSLIDNPPDLPEQYHNPRVTLRIDSLDGLVVRPQPVVDRRKR